MESFRSDDGLQIAYRIWGDDDGVPVLLHHGFGASAALDWVATGVVGALLDADRRVVAVDARGHGASDKPHDAARYGEPRMARDVVGLLDELGAGEVDLVGYSMGAVVALLTAAREPRVRRLVVGGIGHAAAERGGVDTSALDPAALRDALLTDDVTSILHPGAAAFRRFADDTGADRQALAAQAQRVHRDPIRLDRITAPTLMLAGRDDPLATRPEVLAAALPDARLLLVDGDHGGALQEAAFREAIVAFLGDTSRGGD